jgi:hypothetical protein
VIIDSPQDVPSGLFVGLDDHGAMTALGEFLTQRKAPYMIQSKRILGLHEAVGGQLLLSANNTTPVRRILPTSLEVRRTSGPPR